ncbi:MAG TPA: MFS transporter [Dehalococcoidia bacterium]|nr:MFS transporter [Dehalococcoidia bacterium]
MAVAERRSVAVEPAGDAESRGRFNTFRSLRYRDYRLLWIGTLFASSAQWVQQITVGWVAYQLTGSAFMLGAVNGARALPLLFLAPFGGVAADRIDRKQLMLWSQVLLLVSSVIMAAIVLSGAVEVWHLIVYMMVTGVAWAFNNPVRQSVVPNLVPRADLMNALALNSVGFNITRIIGPTVAGILVVQLGPGENFLIQAVAYVGMAALVLPMAVPAMKRATDVSVRENLMDGATYVWQNPMLRSMLLLALVPMVIGLPYTALMPIFAKEVLDSGAGGYGLLMSAVGLGAVIGTLTLATLGSVKHKGFVVLGAIFMLGASLIAFSLSRSFELSLVLMVITGAAQMVYMTTNQTVLQLMIPDEMRGRVMGIYMLNQGLVPFGSLMAGALADVTSAPTAVLIMGSMVCLLALAFAARAKEMRAA